MKLKRIFDIIDYRCKTNPTSNSLNTKRNDKWQSTSNKKFVEKSYKVSSELLTKNVQIGENIGIITTNNITEWNILDIGIQRIGAISVPVYPTLSDTDLIYIFNHSTVRVCFVSDKNLYNKVLKVKDKIPSLELIFSFDKIEGVVDFEKLISSTNVETEKIDRISNAIKEDDLATIIYTSGTTGIPKGVMLSHKNIVSNVLQSSFKFDWQKDMKVISFLPCCHVFERTLHYLYIYENCKIYFAESIEHLLSNMKEVKPVMMTVVPRLLEKFYNAIISKGNELSGIKKSLFFWAVRLGEKFPNDRKASFGYNLKLYIARKLVFSKWKLAFGGNIKTLISGAAALPPQINKIFNASGILVLEGYGLTETSPVVSVNSLAEGGFLIGTIGSPIREIKVKTSDDGELYIKGDNVMLGYYKESKLTSEVMTSDGYFKTGDAAEIDSNGFLKITGRKKEIFKTSGGKYIAPQAIENLFKQSTLIEQIVVLGEGQKMPIAIIQPNFLNLQIELQKENIQISQDDLNSLVSHTKIISLFNELKRKKNKALGQWERIKQLVIVPDIWSVDNALITPTFKVRKNQVIEKYKDLIDKVYND